MPLVYTEAIWRALYALPRPDSPPLSYVPGEWPDRDQQRQSARIEALLSAGILQNASIVVVGTGWGFEMEYLLDNGLTDVWGIDPSPFVWANTDLIRPDVLPRMVNATLGVTPTNDIRALLGGAGMPNPQRGSFIIDADAVSSQQNDAGIAAFLNGCEGLLQGGAHGHIIHLVTPIQESGMPGDSAILWKTLAEWEAYRPAHTWVDVRSVWQ